MKGATPAMWRALEVLRKESETLARNEVQNSGMARELVDLQASHTAQIAKAIYRNRRAREACFPEASFADPAWDILLDLYVSQVEGKRIAVSSACIAAAVPATTALRFLASLHEVGLLERYPDQQDGRKTYVKLSDQAMQRMHDFLRHQEGVRETTRRQLLADRPIEQINEQIGTQREP